MRAAVEASMKRSHLLAIAAGLLLSGCVRVPTGPTVMVLPGKGKDFEQFRGDDMVCRQWAAHQTGAAAQSSNDAAVGSAAAGTLLGAATGAAIGAAAGDPGTGAAVGSAFGLLAGSNIGAEQAAGDQWSLQRRYNIAYIQCMYSKGHQVPVPPGALPPPAAPRPRVPPPPVGSPPPPPPGW